ncbi:ATP-binding cassette sub-family C member 4-like isoform X2 [Sitodiplosis mosellana]|uniref:ATP-binding cassette sub-family C member 4-like isoform X2 n=1 Tax=Sitodiplosis mosellana TaxID=263140 RepID=UPI002443C99F|nr:ATP-binding cassette sub-family C member 4-like isoform X2 [Sitodiplosis mosellana]
MALVYLRSLLAMASVCFIICSRACITTLRLSQRALSNTAPGKLVNLLSNDVQRFESVALLHPLWISPFTAAIASFILWTHIRWAAVIGLIVVFLFIPAQSYASRLSAIFRFKTALRTDERVRLMDEIISGVQVLKMYAWEKPFERLISAARRRELSVILKNSYIRALHLTLFLFATRVALFGTVLSFVWLYGPENLTVSKMFMTSYLLNVITLGMCRIFIRSITEMGEVYIALKRLQIFFEYEEKTEVSSNGSEVISSDELDKQHLAVRLKNVSAEWSAVKNENDKNSAKLTKKIGSYQNKDELNSIESKLFKLKDINLEVPKGKLIFVVGSVGAGKSTLAQVLLKELPLTHGASGINGTTSYASQVSWTFTSSIRQNIVFGQHMDRARYDEVVKCAALTKDFEQFSNGDMTMVGENGAGLSGGQKARINFARALYRKADIYLIDDPLSAVDTHVQSHLFHKCIGPNGYLARQNATRILITHQLHFMKEADWIVVLKDGKIETQGDYNTVLKSGIDFTSMLHQTENDENEQESVENKRRNSASSQRSRLSSSGSLNKEGISPNEEENELNEKSEMVKELEASSKGKIKGSMLLNYLNSANMPCALMFMYALFISTQLSGSIADVWVSYWIRNEESRSHLLNYSSSSFNRTSSATDTNTWPTETYIFIYCGIIFSLILFAATRSATFCRVCIRASQNLHDTMFHGLILTTMRFFDVNPTGRIMNRFTKDLGNVDEMLPRILLEAPQGILLALGAIAVTIFTDLKLAIVILVMAVVFLFARKIYLKCSTNIVRLEGITKSPVFTHISATLGGLSVVRSFQAEQILREEFERHQNLNTGTWFMFLGASSGFGISIDLVVYVFIGFVIYLFLIVNEGVTGDRVGLAITQVMSLSGILQYAVRQSADVTNQLTSVERILEYSQLERETQPEVPQKVSADWPSKGKVEFKRVSYRYSAEDEPVLRELSFSVQPNEKVSVVGRTGAGKSSLISSIFRLAIVDGDILLDDVNASSVELSVLRSRISIIPQEPTLFSGTLRRNLDPFEEYSDADIWSALENVELKEYVSKNNGLQMPVQAHGQNFSTGQRQILCLARAILRKNRIIILDEATANVDLRTDEMIQKTIREKFVDSTVITVAHRLNTVIDSDRVLVMDAGTAVEFDTPYLLMQNEEGVFRKMIEALGQQERNRLFSKAKAIFDSAKQQ